MRAAERAMTNAADPTTDWMFVRPIAATLALLATTLTGLAVAAPADAAGGVIIYRAYYDSPGSDTGSNSSLNAEWIQLKNTSSTTKYITGWTLRDAQSHVYKFPTTKIGPGKYMKVHTGKGSNDSNDRFWGSSWYVWNNSGDTAYLRNKSGTLVDSCKWGSSGDSKYC